MISHHINGLNNIFNDFDFLENNKDVYERIKIQNKVREWVINIIAVDRGLKQENSWASLFFVILEKLKNYDPVKMEFKQTRIEYDRL